MIPTPGQYRDKLLKDIKQFDTLEVPANTTLRLAFSDIALPTWCYAVDIKYSLNTSPDPHFHCPVTIKFQTKKYMPYYGQPNHEL